MSFNFFDKYFRLTFLFVILIEILSLCANIFPVFNLICFCVLLFVFLVISLEDLKYGVYIVFAELVVGSHGYLFDFNLDSTKVSFRIGLFLILMSVWLVKMIQQRNISFIQNKYTKNYILIFCALVLGGINGYFSGNSFSNIFFDINGYLFFILILPFLTVLNSFRQINELIQVYLGALLATTLKVLFLFYLFAHDMWIMAPSLYKWVRDTRVGEITKIKENFFRIFFQSQIYTLGGFLLILTIILTVFLLKQRNVKKEIDKNQIYFFVLSVLFSTSILISLSRSFWAGLIVVFGLFFFLFLFLYKKKFFSLKNILNLGIAIGITSFILMNVLMKFPYPQQGKIPSYAFDLIKERAGSLVKEDAVASRWSMLPPLMKEISERPFLGHGFGKTVTYKSSDPRVVASTAGQTGIYTTFAFEWGYLDMWLKLGVIGAGLYLYLLFVLFIDGFKFAIKGINQLSHEDTIQNEYVIAIGLLFGFVAVAMTHGFSPYLNHPLGIGFLVIITSYWVLMNRFSLKK